MPQDVNCPKCQHVFPVAEARQAFGVQCPSCDVEFTAEFRKVPVPAPGEPPYELLVSNGKPAGMLVLEAKKKAKDDDEEKVRQGGSMTMVVIVAVSALLITLGALGFTGYYLFTHTDTTEYVSTGGGNRPNTNNNNNRPNPGGGTKVNPGGGTQQPPKTVFTDFPMDRWKFRAKFPGRPQEQTQAGPNGTTVTTFSLETGKGGMAIAVSDLSLPAKMTQAQYTSTLDGAMLGMVKGMGGNVQNTNQWSTGAGSGKIYIGEVNASIGNPRAGLLRANVYLQGSRLYQVMVFGDRSYVDHEDATTFLKGFSINR